MSRRKRDRKSMGGAAAASGAAESGREPGRFSARRKTETILRLLRGESLDSLARELGVTAATLAQWREAFLAGGQTALKSRLADERDDEIQRLRAKVGEITMNNELLLYLRIPQNPERPPGYVRIVRTRGSSRSCSSATIVRHDPRTELRSSSSEPPLHRWPGAAHGA